MKYYNGIADYNETKDTIVTLGKFDGLHRGHQKLIQRVMAERQKLVKVVCAFDMKDFNRLLGRKEQYLMVGKERKHFLEDKVDTLIECVFTKELQEMTAEKFVEQVLVNTLHAKVVVVGEEFRFGFQKKGDIDVLKSFGKQHGFELHVVTKEYDGETKVSSSTIKSKVQGGELIGANELLGYSYFLEGKVESGRQLGRTLGFPTMNIYPDLCKVLPPNGVYLCKVLLNKIVKNGIVNIGVKPTITKDAVMTAEVHVFDYDGNEYGNEIKIEFIQFLRGEQKFDSIDELKNQVHLDMKSATAFFAEV